MPTYEEAVDTNCKIIIFNFFYTSLKLNFCSKAPPPTYDALFGKVREARNTSSGILGFMMNVFIILIGTSKLIFDELNSNIN